PAQMVLQLCGRVCRRLSLKTLSSPDRVFCFAPFSKNNALRNTPAGSAEVKNVLKEENFIYCKLFRISKRPLFFQ
ncbi:hypothetical protein, partial [Flavobacterium sp. MR2016-29]|uniref:hypothetical protein n=1 Tax=Flavobacterium sp. MR2016-29 TaxID=2783795 RepID=UPI001E47671C